MSEEIECEGGWGNFEMGVEEHPSLSRLRRQELAGSKAGKGKGASAVQC